MSTALKEPPKKKAKKIQKKLTGPGELPLVIETPDTPLNRAGIRARDAQAAYDKAALELGEAKKELAKALKQAKRFLVICGPYTFCRIHTDAKDGIKVEKQK